jgi:hypothetical protein
MFLSLFALFFSARPQVLFNKNLYQIAISLARSQGSDEAAVMEIYQMFGDHLVRRLFVLLPRFFSFQLSESESSQNQTAPFIVCALKILFRFLSLLPVQEGRL